MSRSSVAFLLGFVGLVAPSAAEEPKRTDAYGDPLPAGVVRRIGTVRFRHGSTVGKVAYSPDGQLLASVDGWGETVRLWEAATGKPLWVFNLGQSGYSVAFAPDGRVLAVGTERGVLLWDLATGKEMKRIAAGACRALAFSPDGRTLAHGEGVHLTDVATGKELRTLAWHKQGVSGLAFSSDGKLLASCSPDGTIRVGEIASDKEPATLQLEGKEKDEEVHAIAFSPDGKTLVSGGHYYVPVAPRQVRSVGTLRLWDVATSKLLREFNVLGNLGCYQAVAFSPDGTTLASSEIDKTTRLWDVASGTMLRQLQPQRTLKYSVHSLTFSPDGKTLASGGNDHTVYLWDVATGKQLTPEGPEGKVSGLAISSDGLLLATGGHEPLIRLWDLPAGKQLRTLQGSEGIYTLALSSDGKQLVSGSWDKTVRLWDTATGEEVWSSRSKDCRSCASPSRRTASWWRQPMWTSKAFACGKARASFNSGTQPRARKFVRCRSLLG